MLVVLVVLLLGADESFDRTKTGEYNDTVDSKRVGKSTYSLIVR